MRYEQIACTRFLSRPAAIFLLLFLVLSSPPAGAGQDKTTAGQPAMSELLRMPAKLLAKGTNKRRIGALRLVSYRLEEITLAAPVEVSVRGEKVLSDRAWRVTVTGGPFAVRAMPPIIWVDSVPLGVAQESEQLDELTVITFDRKALREGATIAVSYSVAGDAFGTDAVFPASVAEDRKELIEKLSIGSAR